MEQRPYKNSKTLRGTIDKFQSYSINKHNYSYIQKELTSYNMPVSKIIEDNSLQITLTQLRLMTFPKVPGSGGTAMNPSVIIPCGHHIPISKAAMFVNCLGCGDPLCTSCAQYLDNICRDCTNLLTTSV